MARTDQRISTKQQPIRGHPLPLDLGRMPLAFRPPQETHLGYTQLVG